MKYGFVNDLCADYHEELDCWQLCEPLIYQRRNGDQIVVPKGFITDLASTRNIPWFPSDGPYNQAAVVHDFLYAGEFVPRRISDEIFREAMESIKQVPRWKIPIMWSAVRVFGGFTYRGHTLKSVHALRLLARVPDNENRPLWSDGVMRFM